MGEMIFTETELLVMELGGDPLEGWEEFEPAMEEAAA